MHSLPLALALLSAWILAPAFLQTLSRAGRTRPNYRDRALPVPFGALVPAAALVALVPLTVIDRLGPSEIFQPELLPISVYALGVALLGLLDDLLGSDGGPRGWRGHGAALLRGELSTGVLKAAGSLGLALLAMSYLSLSDGRWLLGTAVLVLATNLFNLLDLRPGRSAKAFVLLGGGLTIGAGLRPLWALGLFAGPALVAGVYDLRERAMLGDTGANLLGALAGLWLVLTLSQTGQLIALLLLVALTVYGEISSISEFVERTPWLRELDSWGRPS
jgi:UDP-N-acetylmuramyl pentapeptide phosphotransferase/UDP-N-acetylglucosamine-1-phosphate transferase